MPMILAGNGLSWRMQHCPVACHFAFTRTSISVVSGSGGDPADSIPRGGYSVRESKVGPAFKPEEFTTRKTIEMTFFL